MPNPTILCVAYGGGHVNACLPAAMALNARGWDVHFLALTTAYDCVIRAGAIGAGLRVWQARDLIGPADDNILFHGTRIAGSAGANAAVSREESAAYHGFGYHDLAETHGDQQAEALFAKGGRAAFEHRILAARIIEKTAPDCVLTTNSPRAEKAVIDRAQRDGIPAAVLNDTLASVSNWWLHDPHYADRIMVINSAVKDVLVASGHVPAKIAVTGNPALEPMARLRDQRVSNPRNPFARKTALYVSQPLTGADGDHRAQCIAALRKIATARPEWEVRVRLHPNDDQNADWVNPPFRCFRGLTLAEELSQTDAVITHGSTVGIEAALAGIPVVLQMGSRSARECRFDEYGIAMVSPSLSDLEPAIERALAIGLGAKALPDAQSPNPSFAPSFAMPRNALGNVVAEIEAMTARESYAA